MKRKAQAPAGSSAEDVWSTTRHCVAGLEAESQVAEVVQVHGKP